MFPCLICMIDQGKGQAAVVVLILATQGVQTFWPANMVHVHLTNILMDHTVFV